MAQNGLLKKDLEGERIFVFCCQFFLSLLAKNVHNGADHAVGQMGGILSWELTAAPKFPMIISVMPSLIDLHLYCHNSHKK